MATSQLRPAEDAAHRQSLVTAMASVALNMGASLAGLGGAGAGTRGAPSHILHVIVGPTSPYFLIQGGAFPRSLRAVISEAQWYAFMAALNKELIAGHEATTQVMGRQLCIATVSMVATMVGFMAGFLCSFLGGVNGNYAVLGVGIFFGISFVIGIVMLLRSVLLLGKAQHALFEGVITSADRIRWSLSQSFPQLSVDMVNINPPGRFDITVRHTEGEQVTAAGAHAIHSGSQQQTYGAPQEHRYGSPPPQVYSGQQQLIYGPAQQQAYVGNGAYAVRVQPYPPQAVYCPSDVVYAGEAVPYTPQPQVGGKGGDEGGGYGDTIVSIANDVDAVEPSAPKAL